MRYRRQIVTLGLVVLHTLVLVSLGATGLAAANSIPSHLEFADQNEDGIISRAEVGQAIAAYNTDTEIDGEVPSRQQVGQLIAYYNQADQSTDGDDGSDGGEGHLFIQTIHDNAEGSDDLNKNDEYIVFENTGDGTLELTDWTVRDRDGHVYTFPDGFMLGVGDQVTLHSGNGTDTDTHLYWDADSEVWDNDGDTVIIKNATGTNETVLIY